MRQPSLTEERGLDRLGTKSPDFCFLSPFLSNIPSFLAFRFHSTPTPSPGLVLSYLHHRLWLLLPFLVFAFLLQHALTGFCPPVPLFRALGFRTAGEIADEGYALRLVHGLATPGVKVQEGEREKVVHEMVGNKRLKGRFVGEGPEKSAEKGERIGGEQAKAA